MRFKTLTLGFNCLRMKTQNSHSFLIEGYLKLLKNLSIEGKLDLISKLSNSVKAEMARKENDFFSSFGAWQSTESADELVNKLKTSRKINRQNESF